VHCTATDWLRKIGKGQKLIILAPNCDEAVIREPEILELNIYSFGTFWPILDFLGFIFAAKIFISFPCDTVINY